MAEDLRERIAEKLWNDEYLTPWSRAFGNPEYRDNMEVTFERVDALLALVSPVLEQYRKAVEGAPGGAIWTGACAECGNPIQPGDAITWRLRWSPQGPIHEECR